MKLADFQCPFTSRTVLCASMQMFDGSMLNLLQKRFIQSIDGLMQRLQWCTLHILCHFHKQNVSMPKNVKLDLEEFHLECIVNCHWI